MSVDKIDEGQWSSLIPIPSEMAGIRNWWWFDL